MADHGDITRTSPEALRVKTSGFATVADVLIPAPCKVRRVPVPGPPAECFDASKLSWIGVQVRGSRESHQVAHREGLSPGVVNCHRCPVPPSSLNVPEGH